MDRTPTPDTVTGFASLFQGGSMAQSLTDGGFFPMENPDGTFYPATGDAYQNAVEGHLKRDGESIGVYPLMAVHGQDGALEGFTVWWGCVDWDEGPARIVRDGLMGVCNVVGAPTKEVNPKQTSLVGKKIGNGMRLPYPALREPGQHEMLNPKALYSQIPLADSFVASALETRVTAHQWEAAHALYKKNEPEPVRRASYSYTGSRLTGLAAAIRRNGPRVTADKPHGDRSGTLFSLACNMIRQGYGDGDISKELRDAAHKEAWTSNEKFLN